MKKAIVNLSAYIVLALIVFIVSSLNGKWTTYVNIACISVLVCSLMYVCFYALKHKQKNLLWFVLGLFLYSTPAFAVDVSECSELEGDELESCVFEKTCSDSQSLVCEWAGQLDPGSNYSKEEREELTQAVTQARWLTSYYTRLPSAYRTHNCGGGSGGTSDCYCCSRQLQALHTLWSARHGGTGDTNVDTVPQILRSPTARCWPCDIVLIFLIVIEHLIIDSASILSGVGLLFLWIFTMLWIMMRVLKLIMDQSTVKTFWADIIKRLLLVTVGALILGSVASRNSFRGSMLQGLYMYTVIPLIETVVGVNDLFIRTAFTSGTPFFGALQDEVNELMSEGIGISYCPDSTESMALIESRAAHFFNGDSSAGFDGSAYLLSDTSSEFGQSGRIFPQDVIQGFMCMTQRIYNQITPLTAVANVIVSAQAKRFSTFFGVRIFDENLRVPSIRMLIYGLLLYIPCILFSFIIAFEVLDIFLRMLFVFPLTPIWIVCSLFPSTRKYALQTCKFFFSLLMDFLGIIIGMAVMLGMVEQLLPQDLIDELICWIFDTTREERNATTCVMPAGGLTQDIFTYSNKYYADHLFYALTHEHGYRVMFVVLGMYFLGKKLFFSTRSTFRDLLGASVGVNIGGSILSSAVMKAQLEVRQKTGKALGVMGSIPGMKTLGTMIQDGGDYLLNSAGSAGQRLYERAADATANGIRRGGDATAEGIRHGGQAAGSAISGTGQAGIAAGVGLSSTLIGAIVGIPMIIGGAILFGFGKAIQIGSVAVSHAIKAAARVAQAVIKLSKYVAKAIVWASKKVVKTVPHAGISLFQRFFFLGGGKEDKKKKNNKKDKKDQQK